MEFITAKEVGPSSVIGKVEIIGMIGHDGGPISGAGVDNDPVNRKGAPGTFNI